MRNTTCVSGVAVCNAEASNPPCGLPVVMLLGLHEGCGLPLSEGPEWPSALVHAAPSAASAIRAATNGSGRGCRGWDLIRTRPSLSNALAVGHPLALRLVGRRRRPDRALAVR